MMDNPFKSQGFKDFVIRSGIFIAAVILVQYAVSWTLVKTDFFQKYLNIPDSFQIGKGVIALSITNAILFGIVVFLILGFKKLLTSNEIYFKPKQFIYAILAIFFVILHFFLKYLININLEFFSQMTLFWAIIKLAIQILFIAATFLAVFGTEFTVQFLKKFRRELVITGIVTISFFILMILIQNLWTLFSGAISNILFHLFSLFFNDITYKPFVVSFTMTEGGGPLLGIGSFKAIIGKPCSGIDSFLLFTSLYALIFILDYKRLKKGLAISLFFVGAAGMFLVNLLRIFLLFIIGAYIDAKFAVGMFHTNIGWILFIGYFFIFWWMVSKYIYTNQKRTKK